MFRKPKAKGTLRKRLSEDDGGTGSGATGQEKNDKDKDAQTFKQPVPPSVSKPSVIVLNDNGEDDDEESMSFKPRSLVSFAQDEGDDVEMEFQLKKDKKRAKELKRQQRLEEEATRERDRVKQEKEDRELEFEIEAQRRESERHRKRTDIKKEKNEDYLEKYRDKTVKVIKTSDDESDPIIVEDPTHEKFPSSFSGIPDAKAVHEARKRRERMRREGAGEGYIPLDDDQKIRNRESRSRLIREDENDESDEEEGGKFYSSKSLLKAEEERRREEQQEFLQREQGDEDEDNEIDEWEKQQILKAIRKDTIREYQKEHMQTNRLFEKKHAIIQDENREPEAMDIDIDYDDILAENAPAKSTTSTGPPISGLGVITTEDIMAKLKLRIEAREEALNKRRYDVEQMKKHIEENKETMDKLRMEVPDLEQRYRMYQELRSYSWLLLNFLNEKVQEINALADKSIQLKKGRRDRLKTRRRMDVKDQYTECTAAAAGKNVQLIRVGDHGFRASERENRRSRRRIEREKTLAGISHEDGFSTDDEEVTSQQINDNAEKCEVEATASTMFAEAREEFSMFSKVLERMMDWLAVDQRAFENAYAQLFIPKLASPYIRLQLIAADVLNSPNFRLNSMSWYLDALQVAESNSELDQEHPIVVGIIPAIVEKVVVPFLVDVVTTEWDPLSLSQTNHLAQILNDLHVYPTLTRKSRPFLKLLEAVRTRIDETIKNDVFIPMFSKQSLENPNTGCKSFLDRQYWTSIKLVRSIALLKEFLSPGARFELAIEKIINPTSMLALKLGVQNDQACERKVQALLNELTPDLLAMGGMTSYAGIITCLEQVAEQQKAAGRSFHKDIRKMLDKLRK